jgi:hypothetical protein
MEPRKIYTVWTNTDLTEGRGGEYAKVHTALKATARRLAKGGYVQGSDCRVTEERMIHIDGQWYAPGPKVDPGTREDIEEERRLEAEARAREAKRQAIRRARELGMTEEEIAALGT